MKGWAGSAGSHSWRKHPEERTKLWLSSGCSRAGVVLSGWGQVHPRVLALGKLRGKKITENQQWDPAADTLLACVHGPTGADRLGFMCSCCSQPCAVLTACKAAPHGRERQKNAQTKITRGFICKADGAGGSEFPQAVKKGCIERPGWAEHRRGSSLSSSVALLQTQSGNGHCQTAGAKGICVGTSAESSSWS